MLLYPLFICFYCYYLFKIAKGNKTTINIPIGKRDVKTIDKVKTKTNTIIIINNAKSFLSSFDKFFKVSILFYIYLFVSTM